MFQCKKLLVSCFIFLGLLAFTDNAQAANPPTGCTGPGADSGWASPTEYIGYYACHASPDDCPGPVAGWSRSTPLDAGINTHGCASPSCIAPGCAVGKIVWNKLPDATCSITANPDFFISGTPTDITVSWTMTNATGPQLNGSAVALSGNKVFTAVSSATTYELTGTDLSGNSVKCDAKVGALTPPTGGLVPCGRLADNPLTGDINESFPCGVCAMMYMLKNIVNYVMGLAVGIGVFIIILAGFLYAISVGDQKKISLAKSVISSALIGIVIIFIAWLLVAVILQSMGYANIATWHQVDCL